MPNIIIHNVDASFFDRNHLSTLEVITMLESLPLPEVVSRVVLDGDLSVQSKDRPSDHKHPMVYALSKDDRKLAVFRSSSGRVTRNVGAKRVIRAIAEGRPSEVVITNILSDR
jgi:hypothetical protein